MRLWIIGLTLILFTQVAFSAIPPQKRKQTIKQESVESDPVFRFTGKLIFEGRVVRGSIRKSEIDSLLIRRVEVSGAPSDAEYGKYGLGFIYEEGKLPVFSCQEWAQARVQGQDSNLNTYERAMESFFVDTCSILYALKDAQPAKRSFIANPRVGLFNLNLLPPNVISSGLSEEEEERLNNLAASGVRISNLIAKGEVKAERTGTTLSLTEDDWTTRLDEVARADFDGDGIEDIFISAAEYANLGTFRHYYFFLLSRRSPTAGFEVRLLDMKALKENPAAPVSALDLQSSQLTKARITRQEYGKNWPFTADEGELACIKAGSIAVFFTAGGTTYPLNAWARGSRIDGKAVSSDTRDLPNGNSLSAVFAKAFAMCRTKGVRR